MNQQGLSSAQVEERIAKGLQNTLPASASKSTAQIFKENICTLFNLLNFLIAVALALVGAWTNIVFIFIILLNLTIGIAQEIHAKRLVEELSLLIVPKALVIRGGKQISIPIENIVQDDVMILDSGQQVCCDCVILDGEIEANESMLTGESDPISKTVNDQLLSGSSVISGKCVARVQHVGDANYVSKLTSQIRQGKGLHSQLLDAMRKVTRVTTVMIIPLGILLFLEALVIRETTLYDAVVGSAAGLLGMLPKGLVLLISVSLAAGIAKLAKRRVLIQNLYSLESLAYVDTLCLDKTGTVTTGKMKVEKVIPLSAYDQNDLDHWCSYLHYSDDNNETYQALCRYFDVSPQYAPQEKIAFSSARKWGAMSFENYGSLVLGAPDRLMSRLPQQLHEEMEQGNRILILAKGDSHLDKESTPQTKALFALVLSDVLRKDVNQTLDYFRKEGVDIKIISGDHITAVSAIARKAGFHDHKNCVDMSLISDEDVTPAFVEQHSIFGRVTPKQKKMIVSMLQKGGHCVAMTGDGVNDMLALQQADCSIAVAAGSDAVKQMSQVVLLDSDFAALPDVLLEGRRVVNNVTRVAGIFFIKTLYSIAVSVLCVLLNMPFPFIPIQVTLIDLMIEAIPSFMTMLEPDPAKVHGRFLSTVLRRAFPFAAAVVVSMLMLMNTQQAGWQTTLYFVVALLSMFAVIRSLIPLNVLRIFVCACMIIGFFLAVFLFPNLLYLNELEQALTRLLPMFAFALAVSILLSIAVDKIRFSKK